jgi:hypothetical protein
MGVVYLETGSMAWGTSIDTVLQDWVNMGIFEYVLPFLLVFAVIFGILHKSQIVGEHKGINMVIALAIALAAIASMDFRVFFQVLTPYIGVGVSILLVGMIMVGLFVDSKANWWKNVFYGIGMFIAAVIVLSSLSHYNVFISSSGWWQQYMSAIIVGMIVIGLILLVVLAVKKE